MEDTESGSTLDHPSAAAPRRSLGGSGIGVDATGMIALVLVSFLGGGLANRFRTQPLPLVYESRAQAMGQAIVGLEDKGIPSVPDAGPQEPPHEIRLDEFQSFVSERQGVILDARPAVFYHEAHVPSALSLPRETFVESYQDLRTALEASKNRPVAIYCSGADCPDSQLVSDALTKLGFRHLLIYTSGWEEWSQTGLPQEGASAPK